MNAAANDAVAMSTPDFISTKRAACPTAARIAIFGRAYTGGSEIAPKPTPATAAKNASPRIASRNDITSAPLSRARG